MSRSPTIPRLPLLGLVVLSMMAACSTGTPIHSPEANSQPSHPSIAAPTIATPAPPPASPSPEPTPLRQTDSIIAGGRLYNTSVPEMDQFKVMVPGQTIAPKTGSAAKPKPLISAKSEVYDRSNPSYPLLQSPREALTGFPLDSLGRINWVAVLERGLIAPRAEKRTRGSMRVWDREILMKNTRDMPWVRFPHRQHTEWLACSNCHPDPFVEKAGTNQVNMEEIFRGNYCGKCHDRVAFSVFLCERCHSVTHPDSPTRWW